MIIIKNTQRALTFDQKRIEKTAQFILDELGYGSFDLGIWFTTEKTIRAYNKEYRKKDKATDILSFPYYDLKPGDKIEIHCEDPPEQIGQVANRSVEIGWVSIWRTDTTERLGEVNGSK